MGVKWRLGGGKKEGGKENSTREEIVQLHGGKAQHELRYDLVFASTDSVCSHTSLISDKNTSPISLKKKFPVITPKPEYFSEHLRGSWRADKADECAFTNVILDHLHQNWCGICLKIHVPGLHCRPPKSESGAGDIFCPEWGSSVSCVHRTEFLGPGATAGFPGARPGLVQGAPSFQRSAFKIFTDCFTQQFHVLEIILRK